VVGPPTASDDTKSTRRAPPSRAASSTFARPIAVRGHEFRDIARRDLAGDMVDDRPLRRAFAQCMCLVVEIAADEPTSGPHPSCSTSAGRRHQRGDGSPRARKRLDQVSTDKAGASGHKNVHSSLS